MVVTQQPRLKERWSPTGRTENAQDYYVVRPCDVPDRDYWEPALDPDGRRRDRRTEAERLQWVADNAREIATVNALEPQSVLDFGAGLGWFLGEVHAKIRRAVEPSPVARQHITATMPDVVAEPSLSVALATYLRFDVVIAYHVFEHLVDPLLVLASLRRLLKQGGALLFGTPDFGCPCAERFGPNYRMLHDSTHRSLFTLESCCRMFRDCGFSIVDVWFPFPARYATAENFARWNDTSKVSPPWPGNWFSMLCRKE